jgi:hypothetical protein
MCDGKERRMIDLTNRWGEGRIRFQQTDEVKEMNTLKRGAMVALLLAAMGAAAQNAITDWNNIAITAAAASKAPGSATPGGMGVYIAYMQLAVYNAVNAIDGRYTPYKYTLIANAVTSPDAAAIEAAYQVLHAILPDQSAYLDAQHTQALTTIPDGLAKTNGMLLGRASAQALLALRVGDGLGANVSYTWPTSPVAGVWIPTPPAFANPQTPWLGQMRPFTFDDPAKFLPQEPPPNLSSPTWTDDYNQVKKWGAANSPVRTPEQTETAMFWTDHTTTQFGRLLRSIAVQRRLGLAETARLFAMVYAAHADSVIGCYNAKYHFSFWRPVTAIQNADLDTNADTIIDTNWSPLAPTPPHPEYPSAHCCITGAVARTLQSFFGNPNLKLSIDSRVTNTVRTFNNVNDWEKEVESARILIGFHYHHSVVQGNSLGEKVAQYVTTNYFRPAVRRGTWGESPSRP